MWILLLPCVLAVIMSASVAFFYRRYWKSGCVMLTGAILTNWYGEIVPVNHNDTNENPGQFRVMAWNIHGGGRDMETYLSIADLIKTEDADIVFLSEVFMDASHIMDSLLADRYPYRTTDFHWCAHYFYSKVPLSRSSHIAVEGGNEVIVCNRVMFNGRELDVYGCHLTSNNCKVPETGYQSVEQIEDCRSLWSYMKGIDFASRQRKKEAQQVCDTIASRGGALLVMGDMNDISGSAAMSTFADIGLKDAWWNASCGYGATIHYPLPYRIDHILYNHDLRITHCHKTPAKGLSDHDALVAYFTFE